MKSKSVHAAVRRAEEAGLYVLREHDWIGYTLIRVVWWTDHDYTILVERVYTTGNAEAQRDCIDKTVDLMERLL